MNITNYNNSMQGKETEVLLSNVYWGSPDILVLMHGEKIRVLVAFQKIGTIRISGAEAVS